MNKELLNTINQKLEKDIKSFVVQSGSEQRTIGDLMQYKVVESLKDLNHKDIKEFLYPKSKKSLEDLTLIEHSGTINYFDSISHNVNADFSMPNLTSIERIKKVLENNNTNLFYIFVSYSVNNNNVNIESINIKYIWELDINMLRIGSLGKGQLQIKNMNNGIPQANSNKIEWFEKLKLLVKKYHDDRIVKIQKEILAWV